MENKIKIPGIELGFRRWVTRISELLTFIQLNIKEKRELTEKDYELLKVLHDKIWYDSVYPIYAHENPFVKPDEIAVQQGLFADNSTDSENGTDIDIPPIEKEEEK